MVALSDNDWVESSTQHKRYATHTDLMKPERRGEKSGVGPTHLYSFFRLPFLYYEYEYDIEFMDETHKDMPAKKQHSAAAAAQPLLPDPLSPHPHQTRYVVVQPQYPPPNRPRLLRSAWRRCIFCTAISLLFLVAAAYLLWPSDPDLSVVSLRLDRLQFYTSPNISLDATLDLTVRILNQDIYSLDYDSLLVAIGYRGKQLGYVTSGGGSVKARQFSNVNATLQLDGVEILTDVVLLLEDLAKGAVMFDTTSEITGRLGFYFFDLPLQTKIQCQVLVNTRNQTVARQSCYPEVFEAR